MSKEINQYNRKVSLGEDISEEFLIASFFGMNIQFGWFIGHSYWTWFIVLILMVVSIVVIFWIFKSRKMF